MSDGEARTETGLDVGNEATHADQGAAGQDGGGVQEAVAGLEELRESLGLKKPVPPAPAEQRPEEKPLPQVDPELAANLATLAKLDRQLKAKKAELEAKEKSLSEREAGVSNAAKTREAWKSGQRAQAIRDALGEDPTIEELAELSEQIGKGPKLLTEADVERLVEARLAAEKAAREEAAAREEQERKERISNNERVVLGKFGEFLAEHEADYPTVFFRGVPATKVRDLIEEGFKATGQIPLPEDVFGFLEQEFRAEAAEKLTFMKQPEPAKPPPKVFGAADKRGVTFTPTADKPESKPLTLAERRQKFIEEKIAPLDKRAAR